MIGARSLGLHSRVDFTSTAELDACAFRVLLQPLAHQALLSMHPSESTSLSTL